MVKIVLMAFAIDVFRAGQVNHLWKNNMQQPALKQQVEANRGLFAEQYLVELFGNAFLGDDADALYVQPDAFPGGIVDGKLQLGGKADGAEHAQGVVAERLSRFQGRTDNL